MTSEFHQGIATIKEIGPRITVEYFVDQLEKAAASGLFIAEPLRARLHELTRTIRMTDEDLLAMANRPRQELQTTSHDPSFETFCREFMTPNLFSQLQDLRDRYEGLGKYAPAAPAQPEAVKP